MADISDSGNGVALSLRFRCAFVALSLRFRCAFVAPAFDSPIVVGGRASATPCG
jgi:hypothetical protein